VLTIKLQFKPKVSLDLCRLVTFPECVCGNFLIPSHLIIQVWLPKREIEKNEGRWQGKTAVLLCPLGVISSRLERLET
jgi:hypothetical protein